MAYARSVTITTTPAGYQDDQSGGNQQCMHSTAHRLAVRFGLHSASGDDALKVSLAASLFRRQKILGIFGIPWLPRRDSKNGPWPRPITSADDHSSWGFGAGAVSTTQETLNIGGGSPGRRSRGLLVCLTCSPALGL